MPKVSIIVPSYRHARYLPRRLDSLLNQTLQDFELIIIDDCSPDHSQEIIEQYRSDPRVRIIYHQTNQGVNATINEGMALARGEYVHIAESDDWCEPTLLEKLCGLLDSHPNVGLAHAGLCIVDETDQFLCYYRDRDKLPPDLQAHLKHDYIAHGKDEFEKLLQKNIYANCSGIIFRRHCYQTLGGRDQRFQLSADWHMWLRLCLYWDVAYLSEPLVYWRIHRETIRQDIQGFELLENVYIPVLEILSITSSLTIYEKYKLRTSFQRMWRQRLFKFFVLAVRIGDRDRISSVLKLIVQYDLAGICTHAMQRSVYKCIPHLTQRVR